MGILNALQVWFTSNASWTVVVSLLTLSGSVAAYTVKLFLDLADRRRAHFLELMKILDGEGPIAGELAAVYELRFYRNKKDFLLRFFDARNTIVGSGASADLLHKEMEESYRHLKR